MRRAVRCRGGRCRWPAGRQPGLRPGSPTSSRKPILVQHGFSSTGSQWSSRRCGVEDGVVVTRTLSSPSPRTAARPPVRSRGSGRAARLWPARNTPCSLLLPGQWTQEDVLLASSPQVRSRDIDEAELRGLRQEYFSQPRACLRASPLPKLFGLGTALRRLRADHAARGGFPGVRPAQQ